MSLEKSKLENVDNARLVVGHWPFSEYKMRKEAFGGGNFVDFVSEDWKDAVDVVVGATTFSVEEASKHMFHWHTDGGNDREGIAFF